MPSKIVGSLLRTEALARCVEQDSGFGPARGPVQNNSKRKEKMGLGAARKVEGSFVNFLFEQGL
ncbi:hypothetical protein A2U01_0053999, partial [Trifolium medium]|nr:hypothetical protein [Trifolium medium]